MASKKQVKKTKKAASKKQLQMPLRTSIRERRDAYVKRRPHHSFRLTRRQDYVRSLVLPGYLRFTLDVLMQIWLMRKTFFYLVISYTAITALFATVVSQQLYRQVYQSVDASLSGVATGVFGEITKAGALLVGAVGGSLSGTTSEMQQIYAAFIGLFTWLTTIWLLRVKLAGSDSKFRDALYNAGAPIVATFIVSLLLILQLVPGAIGIIGYQTLVESGLASAGILAMLVSLIAILLVIVSVYLTISSVFALVIVTLPGMYPMRALRIAGDLVIARRLRILFRLTWMTFFVVCVWAIVMIPFVIGTNALQDKLQFLSGLPIIPIAVIIMTSLSTIFVSSYIYLLYRRLVDDNSAPA